MVLIEDVKAVVSTRIFPGFFQGHVTEDSCAYFYEILNGTYNQWGQLKLRYHKTLKRLTVVDAWVETSEMGKTNRASYGKS